jgi:hypothetical protein
MRFARWRLVLTAAAVLVLGTVAVGGALAGSFEPPAADPIDTLSMVDSLRVDDSAAAPAFLGRGRPVARLAAARHLIHLEVTAVDRAGEIVEHHLDHGTIDSIGSAVIVVSEADGSAVTINTGDDTAVWLGRTRGTLGELKVGDEVIVHSRVDGGEVIARQIVRLPPPRS